MQCPCGGSTFKRLTATTKVASGDRLTLVAQACLACGRVGGDVLDLNDQRVQTGPSARTAFNAGESANALPRGLAPPDRGAHEQLSML